jgi:transposase
LRSAAVIYRMATQDVVRVKNRLKAVLRARGILADAGVYEKKSRGKWLKLPASGSRPAAEWLARELDELVPVRQEAESGLLKEAKAHPIIKTLSSAPGMGPLRTAQLAAIVITPHRFRTRRQFWSYCSLAIVTRSSPDRVPGENGKWTRAVVRQTRCLNRKRQPVLKAVFKGAATGDTN